MPTKPKKLKTRTPVKELKSKPKYEYYHPGDGPIIRLCGDCEGEIFGSSPDHRPGQCIRMLKSRFANLENMVRQLDKRTLPMAAMEIEQGFRPRAGV